MVFGQFFYLIEIRINQFDALLPFFVEEDIRNDNKNRVRNLTRRIKQQTLISSLLIPSNLL
jgi:hypothetical protein